MKSNQQIKKDIGKIGNAGISGEYFGKSITDTLEEIGLIPRLSL